VTNIKLSICIPTFNRARHLQDCLERLEQIAFPFPYEIVISDNSSTDHTPEVSASFKERGLPVRYFRCVENVGMIPNMNSAFRLAVGEYLVYLADDDQLIPDALIEIVDYMDRNPNVGCAQAPWQTYDAVEEAVRGVFYKLQEETVFPQGKYARLFAFLYNGHVFPEIAVYRSSLVRYCWVPRYECYHVFPLLAHFLQYGDVAFLPTPFYRQVIRSTVDRDRPQGGLGLAMTSWDKYRGGLEYFLHVGGRVGDIGTLKQHKETQEQMCRAFTLTRMGVALRLLLTGREYIKAYELYVRMTYGGVADHPEVERAKKILPLAVAIETVAWQINCTAGIKRLILAGFPDVATIESRLRQTHLSRHIEVVDEPSDHPAELLESTAVLVTLSEYRKRFLEAGYLPNLVFCQDDLTKTIVM
jgi:glycosyltransferase involved in cell wall biosynthesis